MKKKKKKSVNEKICDALDLEYEDSNKKETQKQSITSKEKESPNDIVVLDDKRKDIEKDYTSVRLNLKEIINKGNDAIDGILEVAQEGDAPRAYEVAAQMIKTVAEANKDLMDLHKKVKEIKKEEINNNVSNTTNAIYVGSTKELQELVDQSRSASRRIGHNDIIDAEVVENNNGD